MKRFLCGLAMAVLTTIGTSTAAQDMSDEERAAFRAEVRAYLLENPEVLMEAMNVLQAREREAALAADRSLAQLHASSLFDDPTSFVGGNPDGDITVVEFLDYRCGYCKRAHPEVTELISADGNIRFIIKEMPILGEQSVLASRFALATKLSAGDDAYKLVHDTLMEFNGEVTLDAMTRLGNTLGLDTEAIVAAMDSDEVNDILQRNMQLAQALNINGTPTFVVSDQLLRGYVPLPQMQQIVAEIRG